MRAAIVGISGPALTAAEASLLRRTAPAGVILFGRNIQSPGQLRTLAADLRAVLPPRAVLMVDQEGGRVCRLRPPHWRAHPAAGRITLLYERDAAAGSRLAWLCGALIGLDCADFDVVCAPVLDVAAPEAHAGVVGDRSFGGDPETVGRLGGAFAAGLLAAGIQPVMKHAPGHGRARVDSHFSLPVVAAPDLGADIAPFIANRHLPWAMTAHILYSALDDAHPGTLSPRVIGGVIRDGIGFRGLLISDDLAMEALTGAPAGRAAAAIAAGCDIACYCPGDLAATAAVLDAVPAMSAAAQARLADAHGQAAAARQALDGAALAAERDGLIG
jgi:beta-N-acetylhexosaminidase